MDPTAPIYDTIRCWCGGAVTTGPHPDYRTCLACGTIVCTNRPDAQKLLAFYDFHVYWHEHQQSDLGNPVIEQRAVEDRAGRIPAWFALMRGQRAHITSVLEIGCAHGAFLDFCREHGIADVHGVEVDPATCRFITERFGITNVYCGLFPNVPIPERRFDAIVGFDVLEHVTDPIAFLRAVRNLLADDGVCIFQIPWYRGENAGWPQFKADEHVFLYTDTAARRLFTTAGLQCSEVKQAFFAHDAYIIAGKATAPESSLALAIPPAGVTCIVWIRTDAIGDAVLAASLLPLIHDRFPQASITVVCQDRVAEVYAACPYLQTLTIDRSRAHQDERYRTSLIESIRALQPDLVLNSMMSREPIGDFLAVESGARWRVAHSGHPLNLPREQWQANSSRYTHLIDSLGDMASEMDQHRRFAAALGLPTTNLVPVVWTSPADEAWADQTLKEHQLTPGHWIALFAGSGERHKDYPHCGEAVAAVPEALAYPLVALGAPNHQDINRASLAAVSGRTVDLTGATTIPQAAALLRRSRCAVGVDTGLAHVACAVGIPQAIVLSGTFFPRFLPYSALTAIACLPLDCFQCSGKCAFQRVHCVADLRPEVLSAALAATLGSGGDRPRIFMQKRSSWPSEPGKPRWALPGDRVGIDAHRFEWIEVESDGQQRPHTQAATGDENASRITSLRSTAHGTVEH